MSNPHDAGTEAAPGPVPSAGPTAGAGALEPRLALAGIGAAWLIAAFAFGSMDTSRDDVAWLTPLDEFLRGFEARKDYAHVSWGLLHALGHQLAPAGPWAEGRVGIVLSLLGTLAVPWTAFVTWRVARAFAPGAAPLAALLAGTAPAVAWGASSPNYLVRTVAAGFGLLGAVRAWEEIRAPRRLGLLPPPVLVGIGLLFHPWAVTGPLTLAPLLLWEGRARGRLPRSALHAGLMFGLFALFLVVTSQGPRAGLASANPWISQVAVLGLPWAFVAYNTPGIGWLLAVLPAAVAVVIPGVVLIVRRRIGLPPLLTALLLCSCLAALPEATAPGLGWSVWVYFSGNHVKAAIVGEIIGFVVLAAALRRWAPARVATIVLVLALPRFAFVARGAALDATAEGDAGRSLATELLAPAATRQVTARYQGDPMRFFAGALRSKWLPDVPETRRGLKKDPAKQAQIGGLDYALVRTAAQRCMLRLGPPLPNAPDFRSRCHEPPRFDPDPQRKACTLDLDAVPARGSCSPGPTHATASATLDPRATPLALLALLGLTLGLHLSSRPSSARA
jgi:hypothetical protein